MERRHLLGDDGRSSIRDVIRHTGAVAVVPLIGDDVVLIEQERVAVGGRLLEIPAGKLDHPGEPPETTAVRECEEEIGFRPRTLRLVGSFYTTPGFTDECIRLYIADDLEAVPADPQGLEEEEATVVRMTLDEALRRVEDGTIQDAKTIIGLTAARRERAS